MKTASMDFTKILTKEHEDKWVALSMETNAVVGFSEDFAELAERVGTEGIRYYKVPRSGVSYAFSEI